MMPFVASVPFWFLAGKSALQNSSIVCRVPRKIFFSRYPLSLIAKLKLGHVVTDFPFVVASWFRQNFDQIESILYLFLCISLNSRSSQGFNFHSINKMSRGVVTELSS